MSSAVLLVFLVFFFFAILARVNVVTLFGGMVVYSGSMEPAIRRWDMVFFVKTPGYSPGDVVTYCINPGFCVVHRYIGSCPSGNSCIVTKGDANPFVDPPVPEKLVKGVVVFVLPREVWIPLFVFSLGTAFASIARTRIIGVSATITYATIVLFILLIYGLARPIPGSTEVELPPLYLSRAYFDSSTCDIVVRYVGLLGITNARVFINGTEVGAVYNKTHIVVSPDPRIVGKAFESSGELTLRVAAGLNHVGGLSGSYTVKIFGGAPEARAVNGSLAIYNPNCFPVNLSIVFSYAYRPGESWKTAEPITVTVGGFETKTVEPPEGSLYAFANIRYRVWGEERWVRVVVRYG